MKIRRYVHKALRRRGMRRYRERLQSCHKLGWDAKMRSQVTLLLDASKPFDHPTQYQAFRRGFIAAERALSE